MSRPRTIEACDCETPPFKHGRPSYTPFIWGQYDGKKFLTFNSTEEFVAYNQNRNVILYAHNGGKFDFIFLLPFIGTTRAQIINSRIISMSLGKCELRDSYAIIPVALRELGGKKEIEYWKLEEDKRELFREEIRDYLFYDCKTLYDGVTAYRNAAGKHKTIASNALAFSKKLGINPGTTNHRFDSEMRKYFFGGRTQCFQAGTHRNITLLDIHSAYPFAMQHHHATGNKFFFSSSFPNQFTTEQIQRSFITLECTSAGAFPLRSGTFEGLIFPHEFNQFNITGWEYIAAKELGLIKDEKIISVAYTDDTICFAEYVEHWYKFKSAHPKKIDPVNYTVGKIMMNSLYGKLAQNPARYYDYKIVPAGTPVDWDQGWTLSHEYDKHEIHRRESLWKWRFNYGVEWKSKNIYKNVATGASITGFTRAHLLKAMHSIGIRSVIYCDTDGIVCNDKAIIENLPITEAMGDWEIEAQNCPIGHFVGKKTYGIELPNKEPCSCGSFNSRCKHHKLASKGARLSFSDYQKLVNGETIVWANEAPTFSIDGNMKYLVRNIRATASTGNAPPKCKRKEKA